MNQSPTTDRDMLKSLIYNYECRRDSLRTRRSEIDAEINRAENLIRKYKAELRKEADQCQYT